MWPTDCDGRTVPQCNWCCMLDLAVEHLSSRHEMLASASQDLLLLVMPSFGCFGAPLNALQKQVQTASEQCLLLDGVPACMAQRVRASMVESVLLKTFRCTECIVSAVPSTPSPMSSGAIADCLNLAYFVLQTGCHTTAGHPLNTGHPTLQLISQPFSFLSTRTWNVLLATGPPFQPSKALARAACTMINSVASSPVVWCKVRDCPIGARHVGNHEADCAAQLQSAHVDCIAAATAVAGHGGDVGHVGHGGHGGFGGCSRRSRADGVEDSHAVMERDHAVTCTTACTSRPIEHEVSSQLLQMIAKASKQPTLRAYAIQFAASALQNGGVGINAGAALVHAGAESVRSALHATDSDPSAFEPLNCGGHIESATGAFVLAAAKWIHQQLIRQTDKRQLQNTAAQLRDSVVRPAMEWISSSSPVDAAVCGVAAKTRQAARCSIAVHASVAVLKSISTYAALGFNGAEGAEELERATAQCAARVQYALAKLPSGNATTTLHVQALVCVLDCTYALRQGAEVQSTSQCGREVTCQVGPDGQGPPRALWCTCSELCLRQLMTPQNMATCMHVLSPILYRIMRFLQEQGSCTQGLGQLLATRMELLECLDVRYSSQVLCEGHLDDPQGELDLRRAPVRPCRPVGGQGAGDMDAAPTISTTPVLWVLKGNGDIISPDQKNVLDEADVGWTIDDLHGSVARTGVSGTLIMHVKEILRLYRQYGV